MIFKRFIILNYD